MYTSQAIYVHWLHTELRWSSWLIYVNESVRAESSRWPRIDVGLVWCATDVPAIEVRVQFISQCHRRKFITTLKLLMTKRTELNSLLICTKTFFVKFKQGCQTTFEVRKMVEVLMIIVLFSLFRFGEMMNHLSPLFY